MRKITLFILFSVMLTGCTLILQNISTHGTATDLVDENQTATPDISPTINVPVSAAPKIPVVQK